MDATETAESVAATDAFAAARAAPWSGTRRALGALDHARGGGVGIALEYEGELTCAPVRRARFRGNAPGPVEMS